MYSLTAREWNRIIRAVNSRQTPESAGLISETELLLYRNMREEAESILAKHGIRPEFDLMELE